ncbi:GlxA family transcriptional regulator [Foetidibacter luteolus]|uniref:GlxA family transcriptional regulator n=1 Tax=Foetidibacter luteolus TaxID=2608880 RepID=UPI00129AC171|nr:helix-turn-helix domain-containing protein [Foetidibacter luteolus]
MKKISLLVYEEAILSSLTGVVDIFTATNYYLLESGKSPAFEIEMVSESKAATPLNLPAGHVGHRTLDEVDKTDLIIAPAFNGPADIIMQKNKSLIDWIKKMNQRGAEVASLCFGSYFLAEAGLFDGKQCTSHWIAIEDMRRRYPKVIVMADRVITDQGGIYSSGGAFSSLNLILYLVEKNCGKDVAIWASKMFSIDMDRVNQAHFAVFRGQHLHEDEAILKAQNFIEENYHHPITIEQIADKIHMSKRNFIRRFKSATRNTPLEYLQRVKIESAKKALESNTENISSLMYDAGYNDIKTFRKIFKRITGLTPQDYRNKYSRVLSQAS